MKGSTLSLLLFVAITLSLNYSSVFAQTYEGTTINSKYLTIAEHRFRDGDFSDQITGVIVNNSTEEVSGTSVYVGLYDGNNQLITMQSGSVDVYKLPPGDNSAFSISLFGLSAEGLDHYILYPGGTP
jgi:hypothetical protein